MDIDEPPSVDEKLQGTSVLKNPHEPARYAPRVFPYATTLPYETEDDSQRQRILDVIFKHLYISVVAGDLSVGAVHWTKELRAWLSLKFDPTREQRVKLIKLYYELALAPGIEIDTADKFASMFMMLSKKRNLIHPIEDLILDWRPLLHEIKQFVIPVQSGLIYDTYVKRNEKTATKMCVYAQPYFDPRETLPMLEEFLPYFSTSFCEGAYVVVGLLNLFLPTQPVPESDKDHLPQRYLPTYFHLWNLVNRSRTFDTTFLDYLARLARDCLPHSQVPFTEFGIFTREQTDFIFTAILRMLEIPVGQATSPYSTLVDLSSGFGAILENNSRRGHPAEMVARWIVMSLSPACLEKEESILSHMEALIQAVETFFHPSNSGAWSRMLSRLIFYLTEFFHNRCNHERSGELKTPPEHRINDALKRRFVLCLRDVTFMGIYAKSQNSMSYALVSLQNLASLEPSLVLPRALQSIYPSMQGLVEVHRTQSSLRALQALSRKMIRTKGYRCHITTLLGLALPGIDPNDLEKSVNALAFIQNICYNIPFQDLTNGREDVSGPFVAVQWITGELERMEEQGASVEMDYERDLSDEDEEIILRSSTTGFGEFLLSFLGRVFTLLENIPDVSKVRSGSPEESVMNALPSTFTPLLSALSPDLYDIALNKIADFIANHVVHQARDTMAFIAGSFCKVSPEKALKRLIPLLIMSIRTEIDENGAASTRTTGSDILPRDRALVWHVSMLSMCVVYVGREVLKYKKDLFDIALYMQQKCKGIPTIHISNFTHHLLLNLTSTFALDEAQYEPEIMEKGVDVEQWGQKQEPSKLTVKWHVPDREEIEFAVELFTLHAENSLSHLDGYINGSPSIKADGVGKEWSDEVSRNLTFLRLLISGMSMLFNNGACSKDYSGSVDASTVDVGPEDEPNEHNPIDESEEMTLEAPFTCPSGYPLTPEDPLFLRIHQIRYRIGEMLHKTHKYLIANQEDDVTCFSALYSVYRGFFSDVGIEKSSHVFERVSKLLAADTIQFFGAGIGKDYPRALLVRRAHLYHLQRLRYNASPRPRTKQDALLLLNLVESSVSRYTDIRRQAQGTMEAALRVVLCGRRLVVPPLIRALEKGLKETNIPVIKGALFSLLYSSLERVIDRCWQWKRDVIRLFLEANSVDEPSVQSACVPAMYPVINYSSPRASTAFIDRKIIECFAPQEDVQETVEKKRNMIQKSRLFTIEEKSKLVLELVDIAKTAHWKKVYGSASVAMTMGIRFENLAQDELIDLLISGSIDSHPGLRSVYLGGLDALFVMIDARGLASHKFENYYLNKWHYLSKLDVATKRYEPDWTTKFLDSFAQPEAEYYVDHDYPGWLVWGKKMPAYKPNVQSDVEYDEVEWNVRKRMGKSFDRKWFASYFEYLKQEPKDTSSDKFHMSASITLLFIFQLMIRDELTVATFEDIKEEIGKVLEDGSDKHQHRATSEILGALIGSVIDASVEKRLMVWEFAFPLLRQIFSDGMTPENYSYWKVFIHMIMQCRDPRRLWPLVDWFSSFRLDMASNAAFKESSKINMLHQIILDAGWHFRLGGEIVKDFTEHLDHPYKGVREAMGHTLASIFRLQYHESYTDVQQLISAQQAVSSLGTRPYQPTAEFTQMMNGLFERVRKWRQERVPGQTTLSSYTSGCKTILLWLDATLTSFECTQLLPFFPTLLTEELLHMMDVKEDPELQSHAYHVFRHLSNVPHPAGEDTDFIAELIRIGRNSSFWHQRLRVMINMQIIYFRRLFLISPADRDRLFDCVASMLEDTQHEVRAGASTTLSGMIRCSPVSLRDKVVIIFRDRFSKMLSDNPLPRKSKLQLSKVSSATSSGSSADAPRSTPITENARIVLARHSAVLGLGALVQAFPYTSPPPPWMPGVLQTLSNRASGDSGIVGQSVKSIIGDFKKTRQDTWHIDVKAFSPEQLEDLSGVLWKSYFA